jgi:hypothetical protein
MAKTRFGRLTYFVFNAIAASSHSNAFSSLPELIYVLVGSLPPSSSFPL